MSIDEENTEDGNPPCFFVNEEGSPPPPHTTTQISDSLRIPDALKLLQGSRERISSFLLDNNWDLPIQPVESHESLHSLEKKNENGRQTPSLTYAEDGPDRQLSLNPSSSDDSLSVLRPRLQTFVDEFKVYNLQDKIGDEATHARSNYRHEGIEIRMRGFGFSVFCPKNDHHRHKVKTVYNQSFPYKLFRFLQRKWNKNFNPEATQETPQLEERFILKDINLHLKPGKNYLILGPPASGKTSLLKAIASLLDGQTVQGEHHTASQGNRGNRKGCFSDMKKIKRKGDTCFHGLISYDGFSGGYHKESDVRSSVIFVNQMDHHAPRLTVQETFDFAFQCKTGGYHGPQIIWRRALMNPRSSITTFQRFFQNMDKHNAFINVLLEGLDLDHVKNTFVGDATNVRGVSGGQRRRVSIGEMLSMSITKSTTIFCGDEISTGLVSRPIS